MQCCQEALHGVDHYGVDAFMSFSGWIYRFKRRCD